MNMIFKTGTPSHIAGYRLATAVLSTMAEPSDVPESDTSVEPASLSTRSSASNLASQQDGDTSDDQAQSFEEEPSASESTLKVSSELL